MFHVRSTERSSDDAAMLGYTSRLASIQWNHNDKSYCSCWRHLETSSCEVRIANMLKGWTSQFRSSHGTTPVGVVGVVVVVAVAVAVTAVGVVAVVVVAVVAVVAVAAAAVVAGLEQQ